jgi:DNA-binding transcriptional MerR regulator
MSTPDDAAASAPALETPEIPDKLYFRIGEVARLAGIKPYVLRFWETEFPGLGPKKSDTGRRLYRRKDVEMVLEIKRLLYEQRFTIEGARNFLEARSKAAHATQKTNRMDKRQQQGELFDGLGGAIDLVRKELREILRILK